VLHKTGIPLKQLVCKDCLHLHIEHTSKGSSWR